MVTARALLATGAAALLLLGPTGCLDDPVLAGCADFPAGTDGCPSRCDTYCALMAENCAVTYETEADCQSRCIEFPSGVVDEATGNTVECRIEHAQRAADDNAECASASESGGAACVGQECVEYCDLMASACPEAYSPRSHCEYMCANYPRGSDADGNNTLECRHRYAQMGRCDAAHTNGGGVCGDVCDQYCRLHALSCTGENAVYSSARECEATCAVLRQNGDHRDWSFEIEADTVQCRTYHFGQPAAEFPEQHCPHAGVYNDAHCEKDVCQTFCNLVEDHCPGSISGAACARVCENLSVPLPVPGLEAAVCDRL